MFCVLREGFKNILDSQCNIVVMTCGGGQGKDRVFCWVESRKTVFKYEYSYFEKNDLSRCKKYIT